MARRRIGQEDLIARPEPRAASSLPELAALLDWAEIDRALVGISAAAEGGPGAGAPPAAPVPARVARRGGDRPRPGGHRGRGEGRAGLAAAGLVPGPAVG